jgi:hypothetical protein
MDQIFYLVFIPVLIWLIAMGIMFYYLLKRFTFREWKDKNPFQAETFSMPPGVLRGILTLSLLFIVLLLEVVSLVDNQIETHIDKLLIAFQMMLAFYFGGKVMNQVAKSDEHKAENRAKTLAGAMGQKNAAGDTDAVG